jgi:hypothetical protein
MWYGIDLILTYSQAKKLMGANPHTHTYTHTYIDFKRVFIVQWREK